MKRNADIGFFTNPSKIGINHFRLPLPDCSDILENQEPQKTVTEQGFGADLDDILPSRPLHGGRMAVVVADKTRLVGNPLAEDLAEIEGHRPADLAINGTGVNRQTIRTLRDFPKNSIKHHPYISCRKEQIGPSQPLFLDKAPMSF